ncbi:MAG: TolC family outer membrane protein [Acidovorax sp.]|uniref:TolC family outer membrane protein n=1 Tax=Acidovorax sp. TaxID=1872122 RepID=UPI0039E35474
MFVFMAPFTLRRTVLAGLAAAALGAAASAAAEPLDLPGAVRAAVQSHPGVRGARQSLLSASEGVEAAKAGYKPQVKGGIENQNNLHQASGYGSRHVFTAKLTVSQMLYDFGKVDGAVRKAESVAQAGAAQVQVATDDIALSTAQAWVDAHLQQAQVQIAQEQLDGVKAIAKLVGERADKGATTRSDVEQARSRVQAAQSQWLGTKAEAQRAALALMHLTGRTAPVEIAGPVPAVLVDASGAGACQGGADLDSPAVRLADARRAQAQADLDVASAQRKPTISLDGSVGQALTKGSRLYGERTSAQIGFSADMPLYEGGGLEARERAAAYQLQAYEDAAAQARLEMRQGFADAQAQVEGWASRAPALASRVASIRETRDLYRQQYLQMGTRSLLDLLNAEQEFHSARADQAQGEHTQYRVAVQCLYYSDRLRSAFGLDDAAGGATAGAAK